MNSTAINNRHIDTSIRIIESALAEWKPSIVLMLYSGGYDSLVSSHIGIAVMRSLGKEHMTRVVSLDTHVSADGWREYVSGIGKAMQWNHEIWDNPDPDFYFHSVLEHGMPYTRQLHWQIMYRNLKERTLDKVRAHYKTHARDRCILISGMRRAESPQRENTPETLKDGAALWVSPIIHWSNEQVYEYRVSHAFPVNPFYETTGGSGDCCCNWTCNIDLDVLKKHSPQLAARIEPVSHECVRKFGWGYGERPSKALIAERRGQLTLPGIEPVMNLCAGCARPKPDASQAMEWRQLQQGF